MKKKRIQRPIREYTEYQRKYRLIYRSLKEGKPLYDTEDYVTCLLCHELFIFLGSHVRQTHKIYMLEYKKRFGLDKKGITAGKFKQLKRDTSSLITYRKGIENLKKKETSL